VRVQKSLSFSRSLTGPRPWSACALLRVHCCACVYVCMCVCVSVSLSVYVCACLSLSLSLSLFVCSCVVTGHARVCLRTHLCVRMYRCVETLKRGELILEREVKELCYRARDILVEESNVQRVSAPVTVRTLPHQPPTCLCACVLLCPCVRMRARFTPPARLSAVCDCVPVHARLSLCLCASVGPWSGCSCARCGCAGVWGHPRAVL
jgi:hypothetical protein